MDFEPYRDKISEVVKYAETTVQKPKWYATKVASQRAANALFDDVHRKVELGTAYGCVFWLTAVVSCGHVNRVLAVSAVAPQTDAQLVELARPFGFTCDLGRGLRIDHDGLQRRGGWIYMLTEHEPHLKPGPKS